MSRLRECIERENSVERIQELISAGEHPNLLDESHQAPLHYAVRKIESNPQEVDEILPIISVLIDNGANPNVKSLADVTPLHLAAMCRNCKTMRVLLQKGANINEKNNQGWSTLHFVVTKVCFRRMSGSVIHYDVEIEAVQFLLSYDPNVDIRNSAQETPLMLAVKYNHLPIVHELLNKNASVNLQDALGESVMHHLLSNVEVNEQMLLKLTQNGGSFYTTSFREQKPMDLYCEKLLENHSEDAIHKSITVFRIFMLQSEPSEYHYECINEIRKDGNKVFHRLLCECYRERTEMSRDRLVPNYKVYHIALAGLFRKTPERFPDIVLDKMIKILMRKKYYLYCDLLLYGIYDEYMMRKFAETCDGKYINNVLMTYDELISMSLNMTKFDMLETMMECSKQRSRYRHLPRLQTCSVS